MSESFLLTNEEALSLPIDEVGLEILRDVQANKEWNRANWVLLARSGGAYTNEGLRALEEAWQWLSNSGLIAKLLADNSSIDSIYITRLGQEVLATGLARVQANQRLAMDLHPKIDSKVRPQYLMGAYDLAAFEGLKAIEIRVRELGGYASASIGTRLMQTAFGRGGPLRDDALDPGEQDARMFLFSGAIGAFKNPTSHRSVKYEDPLQALEVILLADLLMRILDEVEAQLQAKLDA